MMMGIFIEALARWTKFNSFSTKIDSRLKGGFGRLVRCNRIEILYATNMRNGFFQLKSNENSESLTSNGEV